jgi:hypothetical protein
MEIFEIGLNDLEPISLNIDNDFSSTPKPSVNFGSGIELLMNDRNKSSSKQNLDLGELDNLENELNELSSSGGGNSSGGETKTLSGFASNLFGLGGFSSSDKSSTKTETNDSNIGQATRESIGNSKTWDGFSKINEIPINDSGFGGGSSANAAKMNDREKRRKKRMMLKKLDEWYEKGHIKHNTHLNMESAYDEVEDEYETAMEDKRKKDSVKLQGWWFMTFVNSMEYANAVFNPFDLNLDGWGEQVSEDLDSYEEIFNELHDKYKGGKLAPELSLLLRIGFSAAVLNFSNKALSSATPAFNDVIKQSPELMKMFTNATVSSMSQQSPGFAFANNLMQEQDNRPRGPPPPAPVETKSQPPPQRPSMVFTSEPPANRPDINASRGTMFREQGVELNNGFQNFNDMNQRIQTPPAQPQQQFQSQPQQQQQQQQQSQPRMEMRGPQSSDIDNILSGLKTRRIDIHEQQQQQNQQPAVSINTVDEDSMISITSLKDLQNTTMPKKSNRRRNRSDKNTISLDI